MNFLCISGNAGNNAEIKTINTGQTVANFSLAFTRGKMQTAWIRVVAWEKLADKAAKVEKGQRVVVSGRLDIRKYERHDGKESVAVEIIAQEIQIIPKADERNTPQNHNTTTFSDLGPEPLFDSEEEIPF